MSLKDCKECGKPVSTEAKACPHCGAKPPAKTSMFTWIVGILMIVVIGSTISRGQEERNSVATPEAPETAEQHAEKIAAAVAKQVSEARFQRTVAAGKLVKAAMREPDSLVWETILANDDASVMCFEYRAKNGFGGMNKEYVVITDKATSQKPEAWNKHCLRDMYDLKHARRAI